MKRTFESLFIVCLLLSFPISFVSAQVVINEFSSGSTSDWVEVINIATTSADLSNYKLKDATDGNDKTLTGTVSGGGIVSFAFSNYLNNSGDSVRLYKTENGTEEKVEEIAYGTEGGVCAPETDQSVGRKPDGGGAIIRLAASTRDASNNTTEEAPCPTSTPTKTPVPTNQPATSTPVPTQTNTPLPTKTTVPTLVPSGMVKKTPSPSPRPTTGSTGLQVLGETTYGKPLEGDATPAPQDSAPSGRVSYKPLIITMLLVSIGLALIAGVLVWVRRNAGKEEQKDPTE